MTAQSLGGVAVEQNISGHISAKVLNSDGAVVREVPEFKNMIVDAGLDYLLANIAASLGTMAVWCKVGTGAGTPAAGDTTLPGYLASTIVTAASGAHQTAAAPYYYEMTRTYLFPLGAINATLTCIGVHDNTSGSAIYAWSQIKDSGNNPTTLTVLSTEQLQVTYRFRIYAPTFTTSGNLTIAGDATHAFNLYAHNYGNSGFGASDGSVFPLPNTFTAFTWTAITPPATILDAPVYTGLELASMSMTQAAYTNGTFVRQLTGFMGTTTNVTGGTIKGISINNASPTLGPRYLIVLDTFIPKTTSNTLSITYQFSLSRYP